MSVPSWLDNAWVSDSVMVSWFCSVIVGNREVELTALESLSKVCSASTKRLLSEGGIVLRASSKDCDRVRDEFCGLLATDAAGRTMLDG